METAFALHPAAEEFCRRQFLAGAYKRPSSWPDVPVRHSESYEEASEYPRQDLYYGQVYITTHAVTASVPCYPDGVHCHDWEKMRATSTRTVPGFEYLWLREHHPELLPWHTASIEVPELPPKREDVSPPEASMDIVEESLFIRILGPSVGTWAASSVVYGVLRMEDARLPDWLPWHTILVAALTLGPLAIFLHACIEQQEERRRSKARRIEQRARLEAARVSSVAESARWKELNRERFQALAEERDAYLTGWAARGHVPAHPTDNVGPKCDVNLHVVRRPSSMTGHGLVQLHAGVASENSSSDELRDPVRLQRLDPPLILVPSLSSEPSPSSEPLLSSEPLQRFGSA